MKNSYSSCVPTAMSNGLPLRSAATLVATAALLGAMPLAIAQTTDTRNASTTGANSMPAPVITMADTSYLSLYGGPSDFSRTNAGAGNFSHEDHTTAYGLAVGNYFPGQNIGFEVGYTNFGQVGRAGGTTKAEGINLSLVGRYPANESIHLLGKVGTTYGHTEVSSQAASGVPSGSEYGFDWSYGVGAEFILTPQWSGVLQYSEHYLKFPGNRTDRVTATMFGVRMRF